VYRVVELFTTPELWVKWDALGFQTPTWDELKNFKLKRVE
jgi:hypothetical protein